MRTNNRQVLIEKYISPTETNEISGRIIQIWRNKHGQCHSFNGQPAYVEYYKNSGIGLKRWFKNEMLIKTKNILKSTT